MTTKKSKSGKKAGVDFKLGNSPLVMVWRRVSNLSRTQSFAGNVAGLKKVGSNDYATIYDAGTSLIGYWVQESFSKDQADKGNLLAAAAAAAGCCSVLSFDRYALVSNPGTELVFASGNFQGAVNKLGTQFKLSPATAKSTAGETLSFVDEDGNFASFHQPARSALRSKAGARLSEFISRAKEVSGSAKTSAGLVGYSLLVSDLKASQKFYKDVLGLKLLGSSKTELRFDVGTMVLTLRPEPALGLVRSLASAGRLMGDWVMFYVTDIKEAVRSLEKKGVKFPKGIEESDHGLGAYFNDPDGHSLTVWQPPIRSLDIDYLPQLNRILRSAL